MRLDQSHLRCSVTDSASLSGCFHGWLVISLLKQSGFGSATSAFGHSRLAEFISVTAAPGPVRGSGAPVRGSGAPVRGSG